MSKFSKFKYRFLRKLKAALEALPKETSIYHSTVPGWGKYGPPERCSEPAHMKTLTINHSDERWQNSTLENTNRASELEICSSLSLSLSVREIPCFFSLESRKVILFLIQFRLPSLNFWKEFSLIIGCFKNKRICSLSPLAILYRCSSFSLRLDFYLYPIRPKLVYLRV